MCHASTKQQAKSKDGSLESSATTQGKACAHTTTLSTTTKGEALTIKDEHVQSITVQMSRKRPELNTQRSHHRVYTASSRRKASDKNHCDDKSAGPGRLRLSDSDKAVGLQVRPCN